MAIKGYWRLNGNSNDASGNAYNGTDTAITYSNANGVSNNGALFNGTTSIIRTGYTISSSEIVIKAWVKCAGIAVNQTITAQRHDINAPVTKYWWLLIGRNNHGTFPSKLVFLSNVGGADTYWYSNLTISDSKWHRVVVYIKSGDQRIYVDGKLDKSATTTHTLDTTNTQEHTIGCLDHWNGKDSQIAGSLDEVSIAHNTLAAAEVKNDYSYYKGFF